MATEENITLNFKQMRKVLMMMCMAAIVAFTVGCSSCKKQKVEEEVKAQPMVVENVNSTDKEYMFTNYGGDYKWFESCILLNDYLDEECDGTVTGISNVFQVVEDGSKDVFVVLAAHTADTTAYDVRHGFWVEDFPLETEEITLTFAEAFEKINEVNYPKPHSKNCILRKPIGPNKCNPQYVFGNVSAQLWVDAITGEVKTTSPAFPEAFKMPLGEWP